MASVHNRISKNRWGSQSQNFTLIQARTEKT